MSREETKQEKVEELGVKAEIEQVKEEKAAEEVKEAKAAKEVKPEKKVIAPENWKPKTILGKKVLSGEITDIATVFSEGMKISEPIIVDILLPSLEKETILIGGMTGKGGGKKRTPFKRSSRMHKSGRRYKISAMTVIGNRNGYVGIGLAAGPAGKNQEVMQKSLNKAKLSLIPIRRGCGSWECLCGTNHSIPFSVLGKSGSVRMTLLPAPKGVGLAVSDEVKKILRLAGISDIWSKSKGNLQMRANLVRCTFDALKKLNAYKVKSEFEKESGMSAGRVD
ncbi:MAG: 30S ribosomal protein S5 [Candidatus Aenigmatarchaeota archaeon]